ncbi:MAG: pyridoxal-phosphate dependent enzyme [Proteobacteria bacterium]|nr:pyridoxal-phosphate dependent enzyme [Pseudomonadota bacterium]
MSGARPSGARGGDAWEGGPLPALSRLRLGVWPTRVHPLPALSQRLGFELWVKREDESGTALGGNKVRKLEFLLAAARDAGATTVVTAGALGSHHVAATAWYARQLGLRCDALVFPQPLSATARRCLELTWRLGARLEPCNDRLGLALALADPRLRLGHRGYLIGPGGSSPLGTLGYVAAGLELGAQVAAGLLPEPAWIVMALGTGGTLAGLALGTALAGLRSKLVGVRVVERLLCNEALTHVLIERTRLLLARHGSAPPSAAPWLIDHAHAGPGYGVPTPAGERACRLAREAEGLSFEATYTGKALAALWDGDSFRGKAPRAQASPRGPVLFIKTNHVRPIGALIRALPPRPGLEACSWWSRDAGPAGRATTLRTIIGP